MPVTLDWSGWETGNLALEPKPHVEALISAEPVEKKESEPKRPVSFPLPVRKPKRLNRGDLAAITTAFKASCRRCGISYCALEGEQWRPRVVLSGADGLALAGLSAKLSQLPELEAALMLELAQTDADLRYVLDERAAIRGADGLPDDDMSAALSIIAGAR